MKRFILGLLLCAALAGSAFASDAADAFANLQKLAGTWEGSAGGDKTDTISYAVIANGSVVMESEHTYGMVTMYHLDNDRLMMTHYCAAKNQPRMVAEVAPDGKTIRFKFLDATNLASADDGHMDNLVLTMDDPDHITQTWTFTDHGKTTTDTFHLTRKK